MEGLTSLCSGQDEECSSDETMEQAAYQGIVNALLYMHY